MLDILTSKYREFIPSAKALGNAVEATTDSAKAAERAGDAAEAVTDAAKNISKTSTGGKVKRELTADEAARVDEFLKKNEQTLWQTIKSNPKYTLAGITATSLATYMIVNGKTNPAEAAGEMVGGVGKEAFSGFLSALGLGDFTAYLPYMSLCCSAFMFMFMFLYMFKTFLH